MENVEFQEMKNMGYHVLSCEVSMEYHRVDAALWGNGRWRIWGTERWSAVVCYHVRQQVTEAMWKGTNLSPTLLVSSCESVPGQQCHGVPIVPNIPLAHRDVNGSGGP